MDILLRIKTTYNYFKTTYNYFKTTYNYILFYLQF